uniref:Cytochrome c oxidase subunit 7A n=1 Tax=Timema tahoe TaxID=61484 RepID=A0A7R9FMG4_9NEOP|nr:unnamed protein product [Timema tahoe]
MFLRFRGSGQNQLRIISMFMRSIQLAQSYSRKLTTSKVITSQANQDDDQWYKAKLGRIKRKQEKFQQDDGVPVYLKGGILDKFLYQATMGLSVIGLGLVLHTIYEMAVPKK